jgi:hypothetical protein
MKASADTTEVAVAQTSSVWDNMFEWFEVLFFYAINKCQRLLCLLLI